MFFTRIFFRHYATFFEAFWIPPKGLPFNFLNIVQHNGCQKIPKGPPFPHFRHCDTVQRSHFKIFGNLFNVSKMSPSIFLIFCDQLEFHKAQRVPPPFLHMTKSICIAVQLSKFFSTIVNFIMSAF